MRCLLKHRSVSTGVWESTGPREGSEKNLLDLIVKNQIPLGLPAGAR